jgi:5-dehydro-2-deoxygluconokinase
MGRFIREQLAREGVDVAGVLTDPDRLTALVILGIRDRVNFPLIFYRENCADMALEAVDVDEALVRLAGAVLINGTHLSQPECLCGQPEGRRAVKAAGGRVAFDIDYRPVLWGLTGKDAGENRFVENQDVTAQAAGGVALCDLIVGTEEEIHILGGSTDTIAALREIRKGSRRPAGLQARSRRLRRLPGRDPGQPGRRRQRPRLQGRGVQRAGGGGRLHGGLPARLAAQRAVETCCEWGNACGAIVVSRHGCAPAMPTWVELEAVPASANGRSACARTSTWSTSTGPRLASASMTN